VIQTIWDPAGEAVIDDAERKCGGHRIVCEDVADDGDLRGALDITPDQAPQDWGEWSFVRPFDEGIKEEFVAAVCVLLPTRELVKNCERDTLFELAMMVRCESDDEACNLQTKGLVEIFGNVGIGPVFD
jgi:hypothetical protein